MKFQKKTGYFNSFDGTRIYYEVRGQGKPIVLCYGLVCSVNHWRYQIRHFTSKYMTIAFDYRGHHKSKAPSDQNQMTVDAVAKDVQQLCEHLEIEKASFWGHSFGAPVLIRAFDLFPEKFHNLVMINGFASNPLKGLFGIDAAVNAHDMVKKGYEKLPRTFSYLWKLAVNNPLALKLTTMAGGFNTHLTSFKDIEIYAKGVESVDLNVFLLFFEQVLKYDGRDILDRIDVPTLIIAGKQDTVSGKEHQEILRKGISKSDFLSVPHGSHCTQLDMPEVVNLTIDKFLKKVEF